MKLSFLVNSTIQEDSLENARDLVEKLYFSLDVGNKKVCIEGISTQCVWSTQFFSLLLTLDFIGKGESTGWSSKNMPLINWISYWQNTVDDFQTETEQQLVEELEKIQSELEPLETQRQQLEKGVESRTNVFVWGGLAFMAVQFGFLARLTWWEYSWDIMEPVTYFVTYATSMACYAYFVLTRQVRDLDVWVHFLLGGTLVTAVFPLWLGISFSNMLSFGYRLVSIAYERSVPILTSVENGLELIQQCSSNKDTFIGLVCLI